MIAAYQGFYEADDIRVERNREFFRRFLAPSEAGMLLGAWRGEELSATPASTGTSPRSSAIETVLMNDLYVDAGARGEGVGRALIEAAAEVARERGCGAPRVVDRTRQRDRPAPLRLDRGREIDLDRVRS